MNYALLFLDRAIQGQGGSVCCVCTQFRSIIHTANTVSETYNQGAYVVTTHCDYNSLDIVLCANTAQTISSRRFNWT